MWILVVIRQVRKFGMGIGEFLFFYVLLSGSSDGKEQILMSLLLTTSGYVEILSELFGRVTAGRLIPSLDMNIKGMLLLRLRLVQHHRRSGPEPKGWCRPYLCPYQQQPQFIPYTGDRHSAIQISVQENTQLSYKGITRHMLPLFSSLGS